MSQHTTWRLLLTGWADGPTNMAVDQAILEAVATEQVPPTLRFYAWNPACLSLGYTQHFSDADQEQMEQRGWHLVRRMTGGRAILHTDELTYSIAFPDDDPIVAGDIVGSYRHLSRALLDGLVRLGADAEADKRVEADAAAKGPVCFEVPSHYEITVSGKKLVGSAQVRKFGGVLQHGSLPLTGDIARICDALVFADESAREQARLRVRERAATLEDVLRETVTWEHAVKALSGSFATTFNVTLCQESDLTAAEKTRAEELRALQYDTEAWNARF